MNTSLFSKTKSYPAQSSYSVLIVFWLLWGIFLLKLPIIIITGLAISALLFGLLLVGRLHIDRIGFIALLNITYCVSSGFAVGAIGLPDLTSPAFYNGEGRIFLSHIPLLLFSVLSVQRKDLEITSTIATWLAIGSVVLLLVWVMADVPWLSTKGRAFSGCLTSHTGAGGFFGVIAVFITLYGHISNRKSLLMLGLMVILPLLASASRAALVGLVVSLIWYTLRNVKNLLSRSFVCSLIIVLLISVSLPVVRLLFFERTCKIFSWNFLKITKNTLVTSDWEPAIIERTHGMLTSEDRKFLSATRGAAEVNAAGINILARMLYWSYATKRFLESPLFGIGFGRWNDYNVKLYGIPGVVYLALEGKKIPGGQAHNTYLHTLAQSGMVGLVLMLWIWIAAYIRLRRAEEQFRATPTLRGYYVACQGLVVFSFASAFFGHAMAAPSYCIPTFTLIGVGLAHHRTFGKRQHPAQESVLSPEGDIKLLEM